MAHEFLAGLLRQAGLPAETVDTICGTADDPLAKVLRDAGVPADLVAAIRRPYTLDEDEDDEAADESERRIAGFLVDEETGRLISHAEERTRRAIL